MPGGQRCGAKIEIEHLSCPVGVSFEDHCESIAIGHYRFAHPNLPIPKRWQHAEIVAS